MVKGKIPFSKASETTKHAVSPTSSPTTVNEELILLRARNKLLTQALSAIHASSKKEVKNKYDLVWFAKYRYRYPNHEASERIDKEYKDEIEKLRSDEGDFHHGFNSGVLAAARMFRDMSEAARIDDIETLSPELLTEASRVTTTIEGARKSYPDTEVSNDFPEIP